MLLVISISFKFFDSLKVVLIKMVAILIISAKLVALGLLKVKIFWNKGYDIIISIHDVINQISSQILLYYITDLLMWPKFGNSSISWEKLLQPQFYKDSTRKTNSLERCSWFRFNNLRLALGMALNFIQQWQKAWN